MMRVIEVHFTDRVVEIDNIPDDAKITFGGIRPDAPGNKTNSLRIYKGSKDNGHQLAVFRDVLWFRDKTLTIKDITPEKDNFVDIDGSKWWK